MSIPVSAPERECTDEQLVGAVRLGDDRAFEQLYSRYQARIHVHVFGMVKDRGRAEDVTQEVFISALRRMRQTERPIAFKPWIYEIARNACIDQFRRTRRTEEVSFDAESGVAAAEAARLTGGPTPDAAAHTKQQIDDLRGAFDGLSEAHHRILVLRELEGLSYQEIGERLGISRASVESTLFRARRRLTEEYGELVTGERCRQVTTMVAARPDSLSRRDERRLARHVAHCQPCRRQAYAAGVDTVALTGTRSRVAARIGALLPLPGFLHLRRPGASAVDPATAAQWSGMAEPVTGWTKAALAAALLVAGGTGLAGHGSDSDAGKALRDAARPAAAAPAPPARANGGARKASRPSSRSSRRARARASSRAARRAPRTTAPPKVFRTIAKDLSKPAQRSGRSGPRVASGRGAAAPRVGKPAPSSGARALPGLPVGGGPAPRTVAGPQESARPRVNPPATAPGAMDQVERLVTKADGPTGQAFGGVTGGLGLNSGG